jgi:DNA repair photolyase
MIISCSRRTDIPAFYSDWFMNRLRDGYVLVRNPRNHQQLRRVSLTPKDVDGIVFWTKNPEPFLDKLHLLKEYSYYFQFTLTPYGKDIEPNVPPKTEIINAFLNLSDKIGAKRVIWRYDPILLSSHLNIDYHIQNFAALAKRLSGYTEKCVISFLDSYRHIQGRMSDLAVCPPDEAEMRVLAKAIAQIAASHNITVETCAEKIDLADLGIEHGRCIDDRLIAQLSGVNLKAEKDKYQRELCGCVASIDIGEYNTCNYLCNYCYANVSPNKVTRNRSLHSDQSPLLIGKVDDMQRDGAEEIIKQPDLFD